MQYIDQAVEFLVNQGPAPAPSPPPLQPPPIPQPTAPIPAPPSPYVQDTPSEVSCALLSMSLYVILMFLLRRVKIKQIHHKNQVHLLTLMQNSGV